VTIFVRSIAKASAKAVVIAATGLALGAALVGCNEMGDGGPSYAQRSGGGGGSSGNGAGATAAGGAGGGGSTVGGPGTSTAAGGDGGSGTSTPANPNALSFKNDIEPIMQTYCTECHEPGETIDFTQMPFDSASTASVVTQMLSDIASQKMPPAPRDQVPAAAVARIQAWQSQGMNP
jgi:hypothetical protein